MYQKSESRSVVFDSLRNSSGQNTGVGSLVQFVCVCVCVCVCVLNKSDYFRNLTIVLVGWLHMVWIGAPARAGPVGQKRLERGQLDESLRAAGRFWEPGCR